ncbi:DNA cytosine methyltransferase [Chromobacterium phragmitis]|uniref:DNA cytosine methyltransferase n=1 Tax=Chromobacterium amazonense TaxID=1382803 RepID=UPI00237DBB68|nr:DNA cytosine methyltransferase [Chromobacterium amazonense]MBM2884874.1 DNA cytosine methyltransferase [Chromobacterium amazonense]MDE1714782.1 DNA cytosine methyltransferase [Chromobacterium amazonense]
MNELALFAGAGGGILGGHLLGWRTVCAVEWEPYAAAVLAARQNDGLLPHFPIWDDVRTFDGRPFRGLVDVVSGGFPCQDISAAGGGKGIDGARSGLWREMARIIGEIRPSHVLVENSPLLVGRGLAVVLGDLAAMGFDAQWACIAASDLGAPHQRDRIWLVANARGGRCSEPFSGQVEQPRRAETVGTGEAVADTQSQRCREARKFRCDQSPQRTTGSGKSLADSDIQPWHQGRQSDTPQGTRGRNPDRGDCGEEVANTPGQRCHQMEQSITGREEGKRAANPIANDGFAGWRRGWPAEPGLGRVANGLAHRVERLKAIGNGQVPRVAATAFAMLHDF